MKKFGQKEKNRLKHWVRLGMNKEKNSKRENFYF